KTFCGGHSLGGLIVGQLAQWDFDGDRATESDRGFNLCRGFFVLDSRTELTGAQAAELTDGLPGQLSSLLGPSLPGLSELLNPANLTLPYLRNLPLNPQLFASFAGVAAAASAAPDAPADVQGKLATHPSLSVFVRLMTARNVGGLVIGDPDVARLHATNDALFGFLFDDDSSPIGIFRASLGTPAGGPVAKKDLLLPYGSPVTLFAVAGGTAVSPSDPSASYTWRPYDRTPAAPTPVDAPGHPYSDPEEEVSDIRQVVRAFSQPLADYTEWYFPLRLLTDVIAANVGDRSGSLSPRIPGGIAKRPAIYLDAENGFGPRLGDPEHTGRDTTRIVLNGYDHLDVGTAAFRQSSGRPELTSSSLVAFTNRLTPRPAAAPCTSRRRVRIRIRPARGALSAVVRVNGRRVATRRVRGRLTAVVDLRGAPKGTATVKITVPVRRDGKTQRRSDDRHYRLCSPGTTR
ncbi:MAG: hypothetical protein JWO14_4122, partial [Solirubrobacterales bacterium]|nr:hypothetical protein [Solirubrobacterales bacterium]